METFCISMQKLGSGFQHFGCGFWKMLGRVPSRWRKVPKDGIATVGDKCLVATPEGVKMAAKKRRPNEGGYKIIPCQWVPVIPENIGKEARTFVYLIRRA